MVVSEGGERWEEEKGGGGEERKGAINQGKKTSSEGPKTNRKWVEWGFIPWMKSRKISNPISIQFSVTQNKIDGFCPSTFD